MPTRYRTPQHCRGLFLTLLVTSLSVVGVAAQGTFPVQVSGALMAPRSLDLAVYGQDRPDDLFFDVTLRDPVEEVLEARLAVSIERNGQTIYRSDPNAALPTLTLQQFEPLRVDGPTLLRYLSANGQATGSLPGAAFEVPEGLNSICLQVFGVERDVAISRQFCLQGSFQLNLVPRLTLPAFGAEIRHTDPQNLVFTWVPMHLGSTNPPQPVEYDFQLVELPRGYYNANDAFRSALRVYDVTTAAPTVVMGPGEPQLRADAVYAWRVRARSSLYPTSKLFQNDGYSQVSTFAYYGEEPFSQINFITDNPAPQGCSVYATDYPIVTGDPNAALPVGTGDVVKLGYFNLLVTEAGGSPSAGYTGKGLVDFPMLNSKVEVAFSGLLVNEERRVFAAERVDGVVGEGFALSELQTSRDNIARSVDSRYVRRLETLVAGAQGRQRLVSNRDASSEAGTDLPLALDREGESPVVVTGMRFTPRGAYLNFVSWYRPSGKTTGAAAPFAATNVAATPYGLKTGAHLVALGGGGDATAGIRRLSPAFALVEAGAGSKFQVDCRGLLRMDQSMALQVDRSLMVGANDGAAISLPLPGGEADGAGELFGEVRDFPSFSLPNLPGYTFRAGEVEGDFRQNAALPRAGSPDYNAPDAAAWRGLVMRGVDVELPPAFDLTGGKRPLTLEGGALYVDSAQLAYGRFVRAGLLPLSKGRMGSWPYSVDTMALALAAGVEPRVSLAGQLRVPVFPEAFGYTGQLVGTDASRVALEATVPARSREMPMWRARMSVAPTSSVTAQLTELDGERTFVPRANFDGSLGLAFTDADLQAALPDSGRAATVSRIKELLGVSSLALAVEGVKLNDFALDPLARPADRYTLGSVNLEGATISVGGRSLTWGGADIVHAPAIGSAPERLGLRLGMLNGDNKVEIVLWSQLRDGAFVFERVEPTTLVLKCNCTAALTFPDAGAWGSILDDVIDTYYPAGRTGEWAGGETMGDATLASARDLVEERLRERALGSFPVLDDERVVVPFLDKAALEVELRGARYVAKSAIAEAALTFAAVDQARPNLLPIDVSDRMEQLGVKVNNLPPNTRLLVTGIDFGTRAALGDDTARMELTLLYEVFSRGDDKRYLRFVERNVPITANSVSFTGHLLDLSLAAPGAAGAEREMTFLPEVAIGDDTRRSVAHMTCSAGFVAFDVHGRYSAPYSTAAGDAVTRIVHPNENLVGTLAEDTAHFHFTVNTAAAGASHSLRSFVAPLDRQTAGARDGGSAWRFAMRGAEAVQFVPGDSAGYRAFVDFDDTREVEGFSHPLGKAFQGLVFDQVGFEIVGFADKAGEALVFPVENAHYSFDRGLTARYEKQMPLPRTDSAVLGGWYYELSYLGFNFRDNDLKPLTALPSRDGGNGTGEVRGIYTEGSMLVPIFAGELSSAFAKPSDERPVTFASGWVDFGGHITFDKVGNRYAPKADWVIKPVANKTFQSSFIPALGMRLKAGSSISLAYAGEDSAWDVEADFSGSAGIFWFKGLSRELGLPQEVADRLSGVSFVWDLLQFEGLTLNKAYSTAESTQARASAIMPGIKSIDFGTWSVGLQPEAVGSALKSSDAVSSRLDSLAAKVRGFQRFGLGITKVALGLDKAEGAGGVQEDRYRLRIGAQVKMMPDDSEEPTPDRATATGKITRTKGAGATTTVAEGTGGTGPKGKSNAQTAAFSATGEVDFVFKPDKQDGGFDFDDIRLGCFLVEGSYGPVGLKGGLNMLRDEGESSMWGNGFKAGLDITIGPVNAKAVGQFGKTEYDANVGSGSGETSTIMARTTGGDAYRYFFVDLEATYDKGLAIPPPSPGSPPVLNLYGAGGGFLFNMDIPPGTNLLAGGESPVATNPRKDNDNCGIAGDLLRPGVNLYGMEYRPNQGAYGGNVSVILGPYSPPGAPPTLIGDVTLRVGLERNDAGTIGLSYIQVDGNAYLTPESASKRRETYGALANVSVKYSHQTKVLEGGLRLEASYPNSENKVASVNLQQKQIETELKSSKTPAAKKAAIDKIKADAAAAEPLARSKAGVETAVVSARTVINADTSLTAAQKAAKLKELDTKRARDLAAAEKADASSVIMELVDVSANLKVDFSNEMWAFKLGSWGDGVGEEPRSGLRYAAVRFPKFGDLSFKFYLQAGHAVDGIPPLTAVLPAWSGLDVPSTGTTRPLDATAEGIAVGGVLNINAGGKIGPLNGTVTGLAGFDMMMTQRTNVTCGDGGRIGLNGWYAEGQAYAVVKARLDIDYNLYFASGQVNIFDAQAAALLQAKLPNPAWMAGQVKGRYSVLGGAVSGKFNYDFQVGDECQTFTDNSAAIAGIRVITDVVPARDAKEVNVFAEVQLAASLPIGGVLELPKDEAGQVFDRYRPVVEKVTVVRRDNKQRVAGSLSLAADGAGISYAFDDYLQGNTDYEISYSVVWESEQNGSFQPLIRNGKRIREDSTLSFRTGAFPDVILAGMLEHQVPGYRQRYWHNGYAPPELKFTRADPQLATIFPSTSSLGGKTYPLEYVIIVDKVSEGAPSSFTIPITVHPGEQLFERPVRTSRSVALGYNLPSVKTELVPVQVVTFPGLDQLQLDKGAMYKLRVLRRPEPQDFAATQSMRQVVAGDDDRLVRVARVDSEGAAVANELTKVLYEYHFAVSQYDRLSDKIAATKIEFLQSQLNRPDFSLEYGHTSAKFEQASQQFAIMDDYYAISAAEGFDTFDLRRINYSSNLRSREASPAYPIARTKIANGWLSTYRSSLGWDDQMFLTAATADIYRSTSDRQLERRTYSWYIPRERHRLSSQEVQQAMVDESTQGSQSAADRQSVAFGEPQRYGLLLQDRSARILLNQQRVLQQIGITEAVDNESSSGGFLGFGQTTTHTYGSAKSDDKAYYDFFLDMRQEAGGYNWYGYGGTKPSGFTDGYDRANHAGLRVTMYDRESWPSLTKILEAYESHDREVTLELTPRHGAADKGSNSSSRQNSVKLVTIPAPDFALSRIAFGVNYVALLAATQETLPDHVYLFNNGKPLLYRGIDQLASASFDAAGAVTDRQTGTSFEISNSGWADVGRVYAPAITALVLSKADPKTATLYELTNDSGFPPSIKPKSVTPLGSLAAAAQYISPDFDALLAPYNNTLQSLPGKLKLNEYMVGGPFVAYSDSDLANTSRTPYIRSGVDIEAVGKTYHLVQNRMGEWQKYGVKFEEAGMYKLTVTYRSTATSSLLMELGDKRLSPETLVLPKGNSVSQVSTYILVEPKQLEETVLKLTHLSNSGDAADIHSVEFEKYEFPRWVLDTAYYRARHTAQLNGMTPLQHFVTVGLSKGLESSPVFDVNYYKEKNRDAVSGSDFRSFLLHFIQVGAPEGLEASRSFDLAKFKHRNPLPASSTGSDNTAYYESYLNSIAYDPNYKSFTIMCDGGAESLIGESTEVGKLATGSGWRVLSGTKPGTYSIGPSTGTTKYLDHDLTLHGASFAPNPWGEIGPPVAPLNSDWTIEFYGVGPGMAHRYRIRPAPSDQTSVGLCPNNQTGDGTIVWLTELQPLRP